MSARRPPADSALRTGLVWGAVAVFVALSGMVEAFAQRRIVDGVLALGPSLPILASLGAGFQAAYQSSRRAAVRLLADGLLAGAAAGVAVGGLVVIASFVDLRTVFVNASPILFLLLSFDLGAAGPAVPILAGAGAGLLGAAGALAGERARRPVLVGLAAVLVLGLFQEMFQLMLYEGVIAGAVRELLFASDALAPLGALIVFVVAGGLTAAWGRQRDRLREWLQGLVPPRKRLVRRLGLAVAALAMLGIPLVAGPFLSHVLVLVGLYVLMGLGLNLEVGYAGLLDLGFVAFFAIGAYTVGLLTSTGTIAIANVPFWVAVPVAVVVSLCAGVVLGLPVLRIRGDYLAIATLGFGEITRLLVLSDFLRPWLGGSQGILGIPKPLLAGFELRGPEQLFYLTLAASAFVAFVAGRLRDSRLGRAWMALREDEDVAEAMGINLVSVKLLAYGLGAAFAGVSGAIFAVMVGSVFPHSFQLLISINVLALIIVGGMGSMPGVVVGSLFLVGLPELLREFSDFRFLIYGAALVLMMQLRPEGLWPAAAIRRELHAGEGG
jgi:branched-chain amino acid transport system permease protein